MPTYTVPDGTSTIKDTFNRESTATANNDGSSSFSMAGYGHGSDKRVALLSFDLTARSATDTCTSATLTLNVSAGYTVVTTRTINAYVMAAGNQDYDSATCNWNTKDGTNAWAGGASGGGAVADRGALLGSVVMAAATYAADDAVVITLDAAEVEAAFGGWLRIALLRTDTSASADQFRSVNSTNANYPLLSVDYTAGDTISTSAPTVTARSPWHATVEATATSDTDANATVVIEQRIGAGAWAASETFADPEYSRSGGTTTATVRVMNLTPNTTYEFRANWTNPSGTISTSNPTSGTSGTTLAEVGPNVYDGGYAGHDTVRFWSYPDAGERESGKSDADYHEMWARADWSATDRINGRTNETNFFTAVRALNADHQLYRYFRFNEVRHDVDPVTDEVNSIIFNSTVADRFNDLQNPAHADYDEGMFLHTASPYTKANRCDNSGWWCMNPASTGWREFQLWAIGVWCENEASHLESAAIRFQGIGWDNVDTRPNRMSPQTAHEYGNSTALNTTWHDAIIAQMQYLKTSGVTMGGNLIGDVGEAEKLAQGGFDWVLLEAALGIGWSTYHTASEIDTNLTRMERIRDANGTPNGTTGYTIPAGVGIVAVGQAPIDDDEDDPTPTYTTAEQYAQVEWVAALGRLLYDNARAQVWVAPQNDGAGGYDRPRIGANFDDDIGTPTGARAHVSGTGTSPAGIWYREFSNGVQFVNFSNSTTAYSLTLGTDTYSGSLTARGLAGSHVFRAVGTGVSIPVFVHHYRQQGVQ